MTLEEAQKVADICSWADGGCPQCVGDLAESLQNTFPEFRWSVERVHDPEALLSRKIVVHAANAELIKGTEP